KSAARLLHLESAAHHVGAAVAGTASSSDGQAHGPAKELASDECREEMKRRKWCAAVAIGAMFALPAWSQQKGAGTDETATKPETSSAATAANSAANGGLVRVARGVFALPDTPQPSGFPRPAATADTDAPGQLVPKWEIAGMYNYMSFHPGSPFSDFGSQGGSGSLT